MARRRKHDASWIRKGYFATDDANEQTPQSWINDYIAHGLCNSSGAFERNAEPTDLDIAQVLTDFVPLSKLMAEQITGLRHKGRARPATTPPSEPRLRKLAVQ